VIVRETSMNYAVGKRLSNLLSDVRQPNLISSQRSTAVHELNISGDRVLLGLAITVCSMGALLWAFVRYWLFAP
jgi:hypothetical protein